MSHRSLTGHSSGQNDFQMVAVMRFVLAFSALVIIFINPAEPDRYVFETYTTLILYVVNSLAIFLFTKYGFRYFEPVSRYLHWMDIAWYLALISLSSGTSSIFFFFFFFVVLYTSFIFGFEHGLRAAIFSAVSFSILGYLTSLPEPQFELDRFLLRPIYLIVLGYMMAYWGGYEIRAKRRLELLGDIVTLSNPRFGTDRTFGTIAELLRAFYDAEGCLLIMLDVEATRYSLIKADGHHSEDGTRHHSLPPAIAEKLVPLPENYAAVYERIGAGGWRRWRRFYVSDLPDKHNIRENREIFEEIAEKLEAVSFLTVPVYYRKQAVGRVFIFSNKVKVFDLTDIDFLLQVINQFMPIVENIRLVDNLASGAAEEERKKIARDIHDSIIQPYIGLQLGIESIINVLDTDSGDDRKKGDIVKGRINRLKDLTEKGIQDLRSYIKSLSERRDFKANLLPSIHSYAEKFRSATGIAIEINAADNIRINDRLAAEIFQIVAEGLSNVRRHTHSPSALIDIAAEKDKLILAIENNIIDNVYNKFTPISISERVKALGGSLEIRQENKKTVVRAEIPL